MAYRGGCISKGNLCSLFLLSGILLQGDLEECSFVGNGEVLNKVLVGFVVVGSEWLEPPGPPFPFPLASSPHCFCNSKQKDTF